jgi:hypothetical protein
LISAAAAPGPVFSMPFETPIRRNVHSFAGTIDILRRIVGLGEQFCAPHLDGYGSMSRCFSNRLDRVGAERNAPTP